MKIREMSVPGYERVVCGIDEAAGYHGFIVIHSTKLGPAVGGTRYWSYKTEDEAITDGLRLGRGMTYKNALAGLPFGGGKSIVMRDGKATDREQLFRAHGRLVNSLARQVLYRGRCGHQSGRHGVHPEREQLRCRLAGTLRRSLTAYGTRRLPRHAGRGKA